LVLRVKVPNRNRPRIRQGRLPLLALNGHAKGLS